jgi:hypothetical protein
MADGIWTHVVSIERSEPVTYEGEVKMNTTNATNPGKKSDDKHVATSSTSKPEPCSNTHDGKVVSMTGDKLTTTCDAGKQHCHTIDKDAKVTCDGHPSKAADLKAGTHVRVTTHKDDKTIATAVESGKKTQTTGHKA